MSLYTFAWFDGIQWVEWVKQFSSPSDPPVRYQKEQYPFLLCLDPDNAGRYWTADGAADLWAVALSFINGITQNGDTTFKVK